MKSYFGLFLYVLAGSLLCGLHVGAQRIRGVPGVDYPNHLTIPKTSFRCSDQKYIPGFYADVETDCQVFHFCFKHRQESFLCPTGTTFNQPILGCDSWYSSNCSMAQLYYVVNAGPGIENAGRNLPMLLKLRDRAPAAFSTTMATTNVFEKISSLHESSTSHPITADEISVIDKSSETVASEKVVGNNSESVPSVVAGLDTEKLSELLENMSEEIKPGSENVVNEKSGMPEKPSQEEINFQEFNEEQERQDMIYDPVTDGYYTKDFQSDEDWQYESELQKGQFQNFYNKGLNPSHQMMQDRDSEQLQGLYPGGEFGNEGTYTEKQTDGSQVKIGESGVQYADDMDDFSKRRTQHRQLPKRNRRKPTYVVLEENPDIQLPTRLSIDSIIEATESPFTESISLDTLVEDLSTEFPEDSAFEESFEEGGENPQENIQKLSEDAEQSKDFKSKSGSESMEQAGKDLIAFEPSSSVQDDSMNPEAGLTQVAYQSDLNSEYNSEENAAASDEDITVYDDSEDPKIPNSLNEQNFLPENSMQEKAETFMVIPDETDSDSTSESEVPDLQFSDKTEYGAMGEPGSQNFQYVYSDATETPLNADSDENIYIYDDTAVNEDSGDAQSESAEDSYTSDETAKSNAYSGSLENMQYSQFQEPSYGYRTEQEAQQYVPGNYYQYMSENGETMDPQYQDSDGVYTMPQGTSPENSGMYEQESGSEGRYNVPENMQSYGAPGETYGYGYAQPNMAPSMGPVGYANYPYNSQYGYYQNPDGSIYQNQELGNENEMSSPETDSDASELQDSEIKYDGNPLPDWVTSKDSVAVDSEEPRSNNSQSLDEMGNYADSSANETLESEVSEELELKNLDGALVTDFKNKELNDEAYYVFDDNEGTDGEAEEISEESFSNLGTDANYKEGAEDAEIQSSNVYEGSVDKLPAESMDSSEDIPNELKPTHSFGGTASSSEFASITTQGENLQVPLKSGQGVNTNALKFENSNVEGNWSPLTLKAEKPLTPTMDHLAINPASLPPTRKDFKPPQSQFPNSMSFPNSMDFGPYSSYGPNMGQQFGMLDSSNSAPFTKVDNTLSQSSAKPSKFSSLEEKVRSMKRGKFGMFKKYMSSIKNRNE